MIEILVVMLLSFWIAAIVVLFSFGVPIAIVWVLIYMLLRLDSEE